MESLLLITALGSSSLAVTLSVFSNESWRRYGAYLLWVAVFSLLVCLALWRKEAMDPCFGLPVDTIRSARGVLASDSRRFEEGRRGVYRLELESVDDFYGNRGFARGEIRVYGPLTEPLFRGTPVEIALELAPARGNGEEVRGYASDEPRITGAARRDLERRGRVYRFLRRRLSSIGRESPPLLLALLLGYREGASARLYERFKQAGAAHMLALSGMHLGILAGGAYYLFGLLSSRKRALTLSLLLSLLYLYLVGVSASLLRAVMMYGLAALVYLFYGKKTRPLPLLCVSFFIQIFLDPTAAEALGFRLSYLALASLLCFSKTLDETLPFWIPPVPRKMCAAALAAQLGTAALMVREFGTLYPWGIVAVLGLTGFVVLWMWLGLVYICFSLIAQAAGTLFLRLDQVLRVMMEEFAGITLYILRNMQSLPVWRLSPDAWPWVLLLSLLLLTLAKVYRYAQRYGQAGQHKLPEGDTSISFGTWYGS
ncbi:MAG TPA: ComEC/Rec2 family competence protein, partial [Sediminispirochaeta sp.]|nr:ComEC/Rec2 family competence protein [Sediminispirochaeta sp.]